MGILSEHMGTVKRYLSIEIDSAKKSIARDKENLAKTEKNAEMIKESIKESERQIAEFEEALDRLK